MLLGLNPNFQLPPSTRTCSQATRNQFAIWGRRVRDWAAGTPLSDRHSAPPRLPERAPGAASSGRRRIVHLNVETQIRNIFAGSLVSISSDCLKPCKVSLIVIVILLLLLLIIMITIMIMIMIIMIMIIIITIITIISWESGRGVERRGGLCAGESRRERPPQAVDK